MCDYLRVLGNLFHSELSVYEGTRIDVIKSNSKLTPCAYSRHKMAADILTVYIGM